MKMVYTCDFCGKEFIRDECRTRGRKHLFCSRSCLWAYSNKTKNPEGFRDLKDRTKTSERMIRMNRELNPMRMTPETRQKLRAVRLNSGEGKTYAKTFGRHTHRVEAEKKLGRALLPGEVVHHIDGNKRNNDPANLHVFRSQAEHAAFHIRNKKA